MVKIFRYGLYRGPPCKKGKYWVNYLVLRGSNQVDMWMDKIWSSNPVNMTKYLVWKRFGFCPPRTTLHQRKRILSGELNPHIVY